MNEEKGRPTMMMKVEILMIEKVSTRCTRDQRTMLGYAWPNDHNAGVSIV